MGELDPQTSMALQMFADTTDPTTLYSDLTKVAEGASGAVYVGLTDKDEKVKYSEMEGGSEGRGKGCVWKREEEEIEEGVCAPTLPIPRHSIRIWRKLPRFKGER